MALPNSMDYLARNGVVDFNVDAYLNSNAGGVNYNPSLLGNTKLPAQPQKDTFSAKAKAKLTDKNFLKKAATAAIVVGLTAFGIKKGKNLLASAKESNVAQQAVEKSTGFLTKAKDYVSTLFKTSSK